MTFPDISDHLYEKDGFCHPDWKAIGKQIEASLSKSDWNAAWAYASKEWIDRICAKLGEQYQYYETKNFLILSGAPKRLNKDACKFYEEALSLILKYLPGVASDEGYGKHIVMMFADQKSYYAYISYFYPDGEHSMTSGIFLSGEGYGHFAFPTMDYSSYRPVLVHELTHGCLRHLPIPLWLNEAIAMRMEDVICQSCAINLDRELHKKHEKHWNPVTIQQFWSGESWDIVGDSFELSYSLAQIIWQKIEVNLQAPQQSILEYISTASFKDSGESASKSIFDLSLGELVEDFLGEGDWAPQASSWPNKAVILGELVNIYIH